MKQGRKIFYDFFALTLPVYLTEKIVQAKRSFFGDSYKTTLCSSGWLWEGGLIMFSSNQSREGKGVAGENLYSEKQKDVLKNEPRGESFLS